MTDEYPWARSWTTYQGVIGDWLLDFQAGGWMFRWWQLVPLPFDRAEVGESVVETYQDMYADATHRARTLMSRYPLATPSEKRGGATSLALGRAVEADTPIQPTPPTSPPLIRFLCDAESKKGKRCRRQMGTVHQVDGRYLLGNVRLWHTAPSRQNVLESAFRLAETRQQELADRIAERPLDYLDANMWLDDPGPADPFTQPAVGCKKHGSMGWKSCAALRQLIRQWRRDAKPDTPIVVLVNPQKVDLRLDS